MLSQKIEKTKNIIFILLFSVLYSPVAAQDYPLGVQRLMNVYPDFITGYIDHHIILKSGEKYDYGYSAEIENKSGKDLLDSPYLADIFYYNYVTGKILAPQKGEDPGRIRSEVLLKHMYGASIKEVEKNLTTIVWCPNLVGSRIRVTKVNGVDKQLQKISDELDKYPELKKYLAGAATFNWRKIAGTNRLSTHSFGIAIDLNVKYSHYWQWDCRCKNEDVVLTYKNQIPQKIVDVFEKHGFIWGGRWYHYDTMHFEYRPELLQP